MQESFWHKFGQNPLSGYRDIVIFMFCAIFSNSSILEYQTANKYNGFIQETFWHKDGSISTNGSWDIVIFVFMLF